MSSPRRARLAVLALGGALAACGQGRPADAPHGRSGDDDELPDPKAPNDLPDDPGRPLEDDDRPLVDPAKEMARPSGPAGPAASGSARPRR